MARTRMHYAEQSEGEKADKYRIIAIICEVKEI